MLSQEDREKCKALLDAINHSSTRIGFERPVVEGILFKVIFRVSAIEGKI